MYLFVNTSTQLSKVPYVYFDVFNNTLIVHKCTPKIPHPPFLNTGTLPVVHNSHQMHPICSSHVSQGRSHDILTQ